MSLQASQDGVAISAVVITAGRCRHLATTLASLAWCDEVLVLASHEVDAITLRLPGALLPVSVTGTRPRVLVAANDAPRTRLAPRATATTSARFHLPRTTASRSPGKLAL